MQTRRSPLGGLFGSIGDVFNGDFNLFGETTAAFNLVADISKQDDFYELPFPLNSRRDEAGRPIFAGYPIFDVNPVVRGLRDIAGDRVGFSTLTRGYFRFNRPLKDQDPEDVIPASVDSPILLIDVDPSSPKRGTLYPTIASTPRPDVGYVPAFLLGIAAASGIVLHPNRQYAFVVKRSLRDTFRLPLGAPPALKRLLRDRTPSDPLEASIHGIYRPLRETMPLVGLRRGEIAAATVFTTGDPVTETARLSQQVRDRYNPTVENLQLDPSDGATHERFWEFRGTVALPQFQTGRPPFNTAGRFTSTPRGELIEQRMENVPVVITIPKNQPMPPNGFPLMLYQHGSNGLSTQVVDRGPILEPDGDPQVGLGPAHVVAEFGIAAVGSASPVNPERLPGAPRDAYLNFRNLAAYRDTFRQGLFELRLLLKALENLRIPAALLPPGAATEDTFRIDTRSATILGQSLGSQFAHMLGAVEPQIKAVILTGAPGLWSLLVPETEFSGLAGAFLGTGQRLDPLHPGLNLLQTAWEVADPITYAPYISQRPLAGHPVRAIYMPVGQGDTEVPEPIFNAMALASGLRQAGPVIWPEMQTALALGGLVGVDRYPVVNNVTSEDGRRYTGSVVQYRGDRIADPHTIFSQLRDVKFQYSAFLRTLFEDDRAQVLQPPF
ncbi:MAG: hypothetical protein ACFB4J_17865 [Elainellaceae cyanobacterium]